ncbi:ankyrin repeat-containing protein BDA1-like [Diospyros lotus]|uniref:ankyrin repeat-containing protein BDA1-like n=1 Tax=Diospyros lotus TaxID=55363 RepID=UPI0022595EE0|nr:ankyrin repeat-containing protein BDA1-like [Diospyros lotus]
MEAKLWEAAINGSVESLLELLEEDPLILDKTIVSCVAQTPLHVAAMLGHLAFVREVLTRKPELASELDSEGCSPLHLAAAKGHLEIVKELVPADPEVGLVRNSAGWTVLHAAAIKGRAAVLAELVGVRPEWTRVLTDRGETGLHLCVRNNRVEGLKVLVEELMDKKDYGELLNWKDCDGNTILHIAVAKKQLEIVKLLLTTGAVEVNTLNRNGSTALDILTRSPRDLRDLEIEGSLRRAGGLGVKDLHVITYEFELDPSIPPQSTKRRLSSEQRPAAVEQKHKHRQGGWLGRKRGVLMVVASLIATVAFQAGLTPPGGVWQDDSDGEQPHTVGTSVMAYKEPFFYGQFMIFNTVAFLASLSIILLLVSGLPIKKRRWMWFQMVIMWIAITAQVITFFLSLRHLCPKESNVQGTLREVLEISVLTWLTLMGVVFIGNLVRMNLWILRKYGYIKEKERPAAESRREDYEEEDEDEDDES